MFKNRIDAATQLAKKLAKKEWENHIVVTLPRGGVPIGDIVAQTLKCPLEIVVPRKIGAPNNEEYAIGALVEEGEVIWNERERALVDDDWAEKAIEAEREEAKRRRNLYGLGKPRQSFTNRNVILIDDGIATGLTMKAAISSIKEDDPKSITVAVPIASKQSAEEFKKLVDQCIVLETPPLFMAVGAHYEDFPQTTDEEVIEIMKRYSNI
jgi:predicted phosphoribosyltransferase